MTDMEIMELLNRDCSNFEKGALLRKAFDALKPSALKVGPVKERQKRQPRTPKPTLQLEAPANGMDSH